MEKLKACIRFRRMTKNVLKHTKGEWVKIDGFERTYPLDNPLDNPLVSLEAIQSKEYLCQLI